MQKDSIEIIESSHSKKKDRRDDPWDRSDENGRFTGLLNCNRPSCGESVVIAGAYGYEVDFDFDGNVSFEQYLELSYIDPAPHIIPIPSKCPPSVSEELKKSFQLFWIDLNAASNKLRSAIENLMDYLGIKTRIRTKAGRLKLLSLHERIELFRQNRQELGTMLLAVKWLGNSGSHKEKLKKDDVLDAFEIIDHVLQEIIAERPKEMARLAKQINRIKGPRSKVIRKRKKI